MGVCCVCGRKLKQGTIGPKCAKKAISGEYSEDIKQEAKKYLSGEVETVPKPSPKKRPHRILTPAELLAGGRFSEDDEE